MYFDSKKEMYCSGRRNNVSYITQTMPVPRGTYAEYDNGKGRTMLMPIACLAVEERKNGYTQNLVYYACNLNTGEVCRATEFSGFRRILTLNEPLTPNAGFNGSKRR